MEKRVLFEDKPLLNASEHVFILMTTVLTLSFSSKLTTWMSYKQTWLMTTSTVEYLCCLRGHCRRLSYYGDQILK